MHSISRMPSCFHGAGKQAQTILELMFCLILILFMMYGLVKAARWGVEDLTARRVRHDARLLTTEDGAAQLNPATHWFRNPDLEARSNSVTYTW